MKVLTLTIFCSLLLAGFFVVCFLHFHRRRDFSSSESDALLPFADDETKSARTVAQENAARLARLRSER